jgi:5-methylcytosine-specific restriction endonuclease McrA
MKHTKTLLLAPWYIPLQILRWEDAIKMIYEGVVDVVVEYDEEISSPSVTWKLPAVIRLKKLGGRNQSGNKVKFSRQNVYARDGYRCQYCGNEFPPEKLTYDHVNPKSAGGRRTWDNIVTACARCNLKKSHKTCDEIGMWPLREPIQPKKLPLHPPVIDREVVPEEWQDFLGAWAR